MYLCHPQENSDGEWLRTASVGDGEGVAGDVIHG